MHAVARDPRRGWWTPEHRALVEATLDGCEESELAPLEAAAIAAAEQVRPHARREVGRVDGLALSVLLALDERRWRQARSLTEALLEATDDLRAALDGEASTAQ